MTGWGVVWARSARSRYFVRKGEFVGVLFGLDFCSGFSACDTGTISGRLDDWPYV